MREARQHSALEARCVHCGSEQEAGAESGLCAACGAELVAPAAVEGDEQEPVSAGTAAPETAREHSRYRELREKLAAILQDLRPGDIDRAAEMAESLGARPRSSAALALALVVLLLPAGWVAAGLSNRFGVQRQVAQDAQRLAQRIERHRTETGLYPDPSTWQSWVHGSEAAAFLDPWQRPYTYRVDSRAFTIETLGADGRPGGYWKDTDLTLVFPYANPRMAMPRALPNSASASP